MNSRTLERYLSDAPHLYQQRWPLDIGHPQHDVTRETDGIPDLVKLKNLQEASHHMPCLEDISKIV